MDGAWTDLVRQTFAAEVEMLPFRQYPMAQMQKNAAGRPLFEAVFSFTHFHVLGARSRTRTCGWSGSTATETNFPLLVNFGMDPTSRGLYLGIQYDAGLFSAAQVAGIAGYYERALAAMAANPEGGTGSDAAGSGRAAAAVAGDGPAGGGGGGGAQPAGVVRGTSSGASGRDGGGVRRRAVDVCELNERANQLAHHLREQGVGAGHAGGTVRGAQSGDGGCGCWAF